MWPKTHSKKKLEVPWLHFNMKSTGADNSKYVTGKHQKPILFLLWFKNSKIQRRHRFTRGLTEVLLNSNGDLNGIYSDAFRCAAEQVLLRAEFPGRGICWEADSCVGGNWLENSIHCIGWDILKVAGGIWKHKSEMSAPREIYFQTLICCPDC